MFTKNNTTPTSLDEAIERIYSEMKKHDQGSVEYTKLVEQLVTLEKIRVERPTDYFSRDQMLAVAGNLAGILLIVNFEQTKIFASKAIGFVVKSKV